jgi:hypothetical protein
MADSQHSARDRALLRTRAPGPRGTVRQEPAGRSADSALVGALTLVIKRQDRELAEFRRQTALTSGVAEELRGLIHADLAVDAAAVLAGAVGLLEDLELQVAPRFSGEDTASVEAMVAALEAQIAGLGAESKIIHLWRDWADLLRPTAAGADDRALDLALELTTPGGISAPATWMCPDCGGTVDDCNVTGPRPPVHRHHDLPVAMVTRAPL